MGLDLYKCGLNEETLYMELMLPWAEVTLRSAVWETSSQHEV